MRFLAVLVFATACVAAPVPKAIPEKLPDGAILRLGSSSYAGWRTDNVSFSVDGKTLYATDGRARVFRWDAASGRQLAPLDFEVKHAYDSIVRGDRLFVASNDSQGKDQFRIDIHCFDLATAKRLCTFTPSPPNGIGKIYFTFASLEDPFYKKTAVSDDGLHFVADTPRGGRYHHAIFDTASGDYRELKIQAMEVERCWLSPKGEYYIRSGRFEFSVYDVENEREIFKRVDFKEQIQSAAISPVGKTMIASMMKITKENQGDDTIEKLTPSGLKLWDLTTEKEVPLAVKFQLVWHKQLLSDELLLVGHVPVKGDAEKVELGGSPDVGGPSITLYNWKTGKEVWTVQVPFRSPKSNPSDAGQRWEAYPCIATSLNGKKLVVSDRACRMAVLDISSGKWDRTDSDSHRVPVEWASFSDDGNTITTASKLDVREWDGRTGKLLAVYDAPISVRGRFVGATRDLLVWSQLQPDEKGRGVGKTTLFTWNRKQKKNDWKLTLTDGFDFARIVGVEKSICVFYEQEVRLGLWCGFPPQDIRLVEVIDQAGKQIQSWKPDEGEIRNPENKLGATSAAMYSMGTTKDGKFTTIEGRSLETGKVISSVVPDWEKMQRLKEDYYSGGIHPSPDGKQFALVSSKGSWAVIDGSGKVIRSETAPPDSSLYRQEMNDHLPPCRMPLSTKRDKLLYTTNHSPIVRAYELKPEGRTWTLDAKGSAATAVAFSPDGKQAVVGYRDGSALVWDLSK